MCQTVNITQCHPEPFCPDKCKIHIMSSIYSMDQYQLWTERTLGKTESFGLVEHSLLLIGNLAAANFVMDQHMGGLFF